MKSRPRRAYQKPQKEAVHAHLRKEWVELDGGEVCVWEMTAPEMLSLGQRSQRPGVDPRGGIDTSAAAVYLAAFCTHHGEELESPRVWDDLHLDELYLLRGEEFTRLQEAIQRVNGTSAASIEAARDFTPATEAPPTSGLPSSASSNSTASPASWLASPTTS